MGEEAGRMDQNKKKLVRQLFEKGKENLSDFDKILIESDGYIKAELERLFAVDDDLYLQTVEQIDEKITNGEGSFKKGRLDSKYLLAAIAAVLIISFVFVFFRISKTKSAPVFLGGKMSLFVSDIKEPNRFFLSGQKLDLAAKLRVAFQPPADSGSLRQGIIWAVNWGGDYQILYSFDSEAQSLNQVEPTLIKEDLKTFKGKYFCIVALFSEDIFDAMALVQDLSKKIGTKQLDINSILTNKLKNPVCSYIYLNGVKI